ncbi:MAG: P1 family peptidase [Armatimonadetes bacterium]|nr:P1 family peptidase [Anaerolineae bacterium]
MLNDTLTAIPGLRVGHATHEAGATGCTVIICPDGTVSGVDQRGGAPGTRETDLLRPMHLVQTVNAVVLAGGSAYGLAAADGVMQWCEAQGIGYRSGTGFLVPIVPAAILMDLPVGQPGIRPDAAMGYAACAAASDAPVALGCVGAGTGCRIGPMGGNARATKGGIGSAVIDLGDGLLVAALVAVNAFGDVLDEQGHIMAGLRSEDGSGFVGVQEALRTFRRPPPPDATSNTVIGVVATNAKLSKEGANKMAQMAQNGVARAVRPAHTMFDGDTLFALATGQVEGDVNVVGAYAADAVERAIRVAVRAAVTLAGVRAWND